jgi:hypothetical protein
MIGQTIEARAGGLVGVVVWMLIACALLAWAFAENNPHPAIAAALPACIALALWISRPASVVLSVEQDALVSFQTGQAIRYDSIRAVMVGGASYRGEPKALPRDPIEIAHEGGCLVLPARMNVEPAEFYRFLVVRIPPAAARPVPAALADHVVEQQAKFGPDKVLVIPARELYRHWWRRKRNRIVCTAIVVAGIAWIVLSLSLPRRIEVSVDQTVVWCVFGIVTVLVGGLVYLYLQSSSGGGKQKLLAKHPDACIVISPSGLAMTQGDVQGVLPWEQVTDVTTKVSQWLRTARVSGLQIRVRGAEIIAFDIYDRSPSEMESIIRRNLAQPIA